MSYFFGLATAFGAIPAERVVSVGFHPQLVLGGRIRKDATAQIRIALPRPWRKTCWKHRHHLLKAPPYTSGRFVLAIILLDPVFEVPPKADCHPAKNVP